MATPKSTKQNYIRRIRAQTAYPTFRLLITVIAVLFYIFGAVSIVGGLVLGIAILGGEVPEFDRGLTVMFAGLVSGAIYIITGKFSKEAAFMLADVADSMTDFNSKYEQQH